MTSINKIFKSKFANIVFYGCSGVLLLSLLCTGSFFVMNAYYQKANEELVKKYQKYDRENLNDLYNKSSNENSLPKELPSSLTSILNFPNGCVDYDQNYSIYRENGKVKSIILGCGFDDSHISSNEVEKRLDEILKNTKYKKDQTHETLNFFEKDKRIFYEVDDKEFNLVIKAEAYSNVVEFGTRSVGVSYFVEVK